MLRAVCAFSLLLSLAIPLVADKAASDGAITDRVRRRLFSDPDVKGYTIEVETKDRVVTLTGTVATDKARSKAEKLARKVSGVKAVVNKLRVEVRRPQS